jgi:undecaprenyl-diphosphatase
LIEHWVGRAGVIAAILIAMVVITFWLWRGITSRELEIREWWRQFCARPAVENFRRRFARQIDWLDQRLSPDGYLGIHLTVGIFLLLAATAIFSGLLQQIGTRDWFIMADFRVAEWFANRAGGPLSVAMNYIAHLGSAFWLATIVLTAALISGRERHRLRLLLIAAPGGVLLDFLLKQLFSQDRPHFEHALGRGMSIGPLDGDLMTATVVYGALAYVLVRSLERWHWRALVVAATILLTFLVALSSLYFGASQLSGVVAAMIEGAAWLLFCISGVEIVRWRENTRGSATCN